jgi:hypothetical protein
MIDADGAGPAAVSLRSRLRSLMTGQFEVFDMVYYHLGAGHHAIALATPSATRLRYITTLLADLAWIHGDREAHEGSLPPAAPEADEVKRVYKAHSSPGRRYAMSAEQRAAVLVYLDALLIEIAGCSDLDEHAPSRTLGREARSFATALSEVREAVAAP